MDLHRAYRFRLEPTLEQRMEMARFAGCCRWVWNKALSLQKVCLDAGVGIMGYSRMCKLLTMWRHRDRSAWLSQAPSHPCQQALRDLNEALLGAFDDGQPSRRFPSFKKKYRDDSFRFPDTTKIRLDQDNARIRLTKLGWVRYRKSREVKGELRHVTVTRKGDHWFMSVNVLIERPEPSHPSGSAVGVDLGVTRFATLSDNTVYEPKDALRSKEKRLKRLQRQLARKEKFSNNWKKQKRRIRRLHRRIANTRKDFLHKVSTEISQNHAVVVMEDLCVKGMTRSARGTEDDPGENVAQKAGLNRAILDQGWGEFRRMLAYKLRERGGRLILVNPQDTSRTCHECGAIDAESRPTQARFECVHCGHEDHADVNAAKNILAAGHAATSPGGQPVGAPMNGEPARTVA